VIRVVVIGLSFARFLPGDDDFLLPGLRIGVFFDREILVLLCDCAWCVRTLAFPFLLPFWLFALLFLLRVLRRRKRMRETMAA